MARGNVKGPLGPIMLGLLVLIAIGMLFVIQDPELAAQFQRPQNFYDNMPEKIGFALFFAIIVSGIWAVFTRRK